jgi:RTX calcium-binding nonapeptide repeat (4 copies)
MGQSIWRRTVALVASATLLSSLMAATIAAPVSAALTCDGLVATLVGTAGDDILEGTNGLDVIVGLAGDDVIKGLKGSDHICGGPGNDIIWGGDEDDRVFGGGGDDTLYGHGGRDLLKGGPGDDRMKGELGDDVLRGNGGNDVLLGGAGNDSLYGGGADDDCVQGKGSGASKHCEKADLKVKLIGPASPAHEGVNTFKVKVKNLGPQAATYSLKVGEENMDAACDAPWEDVVVEFAELRPGSARTRSYEVDCTIEGADPWVQVFAEVFNDAHDPAPGNNADQSGRITIQ